MARRIIVVGANASGVEAASAARKKDRTAEITLLTLEKNAGYSRCGLPFVIGREKKGILSLRGLEDGERIDEAVKAGAKSAVIMGAGLIGLETGVALIERGLKVTIVEMLPQVLPQMLDSDMAKIVQDHLTEKGMCILTGKTVEEFLGDG